MDYARLGNTGLKVSRICLGCMSYGDPNLREWTLTEQQSMPFFEKALELGINFFDTAEVYCNGVSEEITGRALNKLVPDREDVVIATKVMGGTFNGRKVNRHGLSRKHVIEACENSLRRLGTDYIDLYQIHRFDRETPIEETAEALSDLVRVGKVRYIGASSMHAYRFAKYLHVADKYGFVKFVSMQNHYNLVYREEEREMLRLCRDEGIGVIPWSPLARGFLNGTRHRGEDDTARGRSDEFSLRLYGMEADRAVAERNVEVAERLGAKPIQTALAWVLANPVVTSPIIGATRLSHLDDAVEALGIKLTAEDRQALEEPYVAHPVLGH